MKLSCIIPNYNDSETLTKAINEILRQECHSMEIILIDDASTDRSWEIMKELAQTDDRVKIVKQETNQGIILSCLNGLRLAKGEFVYMGSANDFVLPGFFRKAISCLDQYPQAGFFCANSFLEYPSERVPSNLGWGDTDRLFLPGDLINFRRKQTCLFHGQSVVFRKSSIPPYDLLSTELKGNFDWFIFLVIAFRQGFYYSPEPYSSITMSDQAFSAREKKLKDKILKTEQFIRNLERPDFVDVKRDLIQSGLLSFLGSPLACLILFRFKWKCVSWNLIKDYGRSFSRKIRKGFA